MRGAKRTRERIFAESRKNSGFLQGSCRPAQRFVARGEFRYAHFANSLVANDFVSFSCNERILVETPAGSRGFGTFVKLGLMRTVGIADKQ
jgi:hypothetical protein